MEKIPTLFVRDDKDRKHVTREVNPGCEWVLAGEGTPTRKYDGTCVGFFPVVEGEVRLRGGAGTGEIDEPEDPGGIWLARREVKPGKTPPPDFLPVTTDENTGKTMGWEPAAQSGYAKVLDEAIINTFAGEGPRFGTYELIGPKVNGNPEGVEVDLVVRHQEAMEILDAPHDFDGLRDWLLAHAYEGIVWHHVDGRMVKLKRKDFA